LLVGLKIRTLKTSLNKNLHILKYFRTNFKLLSITKYMETDVKKVLIFFGCLFGIGIILFFIYKRNSEIRLAELRQEYPLIIEEDSINGSVLSIFHPEGFRINPYVRYITLSDEGRRTLIAKANEERIAIYDVIRVGSRLYKEPGSDMIKIQNITNTDTLTYYFELWDSNFD
jgi:hypothetical protein